MLLVNKIHKYYNINNNLSWNLSQSILLNNFIFLIDKPLFCKWVSYYFSVFESLKFLG